jgi:hypothetical protein
VGLLVLFTHAMCDPDRPHCKRLDIRKLASLHAPEPRHKLLGVHYFSAFAAVLVRVGGPSPVSGKFPANLKCCLWEKLNRRRGNRDRTVRGLNLFEDSREQRVLGRPP